MGSNGSGLLQGLRILEVAGIGPAPIEGMHPGAVPLRGEDTESVLAGWCETRSSVAGGKSGSVR
ncbi:hypothetical protein [Paraburkholderia sartisoli]|uniref:Uncharacterized protein n=1 Tax=Paraburkholderia sartisoli TaxID=83784 RepID=A0A1H4B186_9BURK|nr:hypothetical protein [Paraburkholderia sartisoli]SEA41903.1 hypothetical protein SAMN05192564_1011416 [Paraburkholderia sartisoli]